MPLTVGCDPEFAVVDRTGRETNFDLSHTDDHGVIGYDHGGRVGELRPKHGQPADVANHLRAQMTWVKQHLDRSHKVICGGGRPSDGRWARESMGGHIHFGGIQLHNYESMTRQRNWGRSGRRLGSQFAPTTADNKLILALDYFIGKRLQKVKGGKRPQGSHYGRCSDIETKNHTGGGFEYRTPPSWLTDPYLTEATLAVAHRIAEMWLLKPACFDILFSTDAKKKSIARRHDYDMLVPEGNDDSRLASGSRRRYIAEQVKRFKRVTFSKTYKMDDAECLEYWTNPVKVQMLYAPKTIVTRTEAPITSRATVVRGTRNLELQICQLKMIDRSTDFENEVVAGVCRFPVPEVKIYPFEEYTPWQFQLTRDIRLRPDTIYFSKELRPFLKIKRGDRFRCRFVEVKRRAVTSEGRNTVEALTNCVFFNAARSHQTIKARVVEIFNECVRTKLRNADVESAADDGDEQD
jgi:hypothetical protein